MALPAGWPAHLSGLTAIVPVGRAMPTLVVGEVVKVWLVASSSARSSRRQGVAAAGRNVAERDLAEPVVVAEIGESASVHPRA